jgi:hypothetical protein
VRDGIIYRAGEARSEFCIISLEVPKIAITKQISGEQIRTNSLCICSFCTAGERVSPVVTENPIINSPFDEPTRHFRFTDEGIMDDEVAGRRASSYFVPMARPRKKKSSEQTVFDTEWTQDPIEGNNLVNDIRRRMAQWRKGDIIFSESDASS